MPFYDSSTWAKRAGRIISSVGLAGLLFLNSGCETLSPSEESAANEFILKSAAATSTDPKMSGWLGLGGLLMEGDTAVKQAEAVKELEQSSSSTARVVTPNFIDRNGDGKITADELMSEEELKEAGYNATGGNKRYSKIFNGFDDRDKDGFISFNELKQPRTKVNLNEENVFSVGSEILNRKGEFVVLSLLDTLNGHKEVYRVECPESISGNHQFFWMNLTSGDLMARGVRGGIYQIKLISKTTRDILDEYSVVFTCPKKE